MTFLRSARLLASASALALLAACSSAPQGDDASDVQEAPLNETKALGMTDVTILYPIPKSIDFLDDMLGPSSELDKGELLPADVFAQLAPLASPMMTNFDGKELDPKRLLFQEWQDGFSLLRVVGVRLDPCFGETTNLAASSCMNTIRLTLQFFQPRAQVNDRAVVDGRSAIHLFYEVSRQDFTALSKAMLGLRKQSGLPLQKGLMGTTNGVHPTLAAEGVRGPYANALKDLLLKYVGEQTLTQIAFCVQDRAAANNGYYDNANANSRWVFGRYQYRAGALQPLGIASLDYTGLQTADTFMNQPVRDAVIVNPPSKTADNFLFAFNAKADPTTGRVDGAKLDAARVASIRFQNPKSYTANSADCVSCHMAKQVSPNHAADPLDFKSYTFRLDHTHDSIGPFRMFGYDGAQNPIIATRVVNETAVVLDFLNKVVMR